MEKSHADLKKSNDIKILIVGRFNFHKGSATLEALILTLSNFGIGMHSYESNFTILQKNIHSNNKAILHYKFPSFIQGRYRTQKVIRKIMRLVFLLKNPSSWIYLIKTTPESVPKQSQNLRKFIQRQKYKEIIILAHSAGGIISSLIYDHPAIKKIICFGYPFKHPDNLEESYRTNHLQYINKPMLIIQGREDPYGGEDLPSRYPISPSVRFKFIEGNHDYDNLTLDDYADVLREIWAFVTS